MAPLEALGFALAGYGCTTCIGNSGPLDEAVGGRDRGQRPGRRGGPVGQPQLRGPHPSAGAGELPRVAAARRRLRARRPGRHRPDDRAARAPAIDGAPVFLADIWPSRRRDPLGHRRRRSTPSCSDGPTPSSSRATTAGGRCRSRRATATPGTRPRPTSRGRRSSTGCRPDRRAPATSSGPACWRSSATRSRPTTSPRPARSRRGRRPASGSRRTASGRSSSTPTAPGAATTR